MSIPQAVSQIIEIEEIRKSGICAPASTLAIGVSRVGGGDGNERIVAGTLEELSQHPHDAFGDPLHSLVIIGKRLHHLEVEYAEDFAVDKNSWRRVASEVYGCSLD
jgi:diphthine synthase